MRIKFGKMVPFPDKQDAIYLRLVFKGDNLVMGNVVQTVNEQIVDLSRQSEATIDILHKGDDLARADGCLVTYTEMESVILPQQPAKKPTNGELTGGDR